MSIIHTIIIGIQNRISLVEGLIGKKQWRVEKADGDVLLTISIIDITYGERRALNTIPHSPYGFHHFDDGYLSEYNEGNEYEISLYIDSDSTIDRSSLTHDLLSKGDTLLH